MAVRLLNAVTTTGAGTTWIVGMGIVNHTVQATWTGSPTAVSIDLEGSIDGNTWFVLAHHIANPDEITDQAAMFHVMSKLVKYVRINLSKLTAGTTPTVTALYDGEGM